MELQHEESALVKIRCVKSWAIASLRADSPLRKVLERELDVIRVDEFVVQLGVWLQLLEVEEEERDNGRY